VNFNLVSLELTDLFGDVTAARIKALAVPTNEFERRLDVGLCIDCGEEAYGFVRCVGCATAPNP
jgi:hypothetical protein